MNKKELATRSIILNKGIGLEIGPLTAPIVTKDEAKVFYLDHASTSDLKKKYAAESAEFLNQILPVDYVLINNSLKETVKDKKFDYVIASHVIEHVPDIVSWLKDIASILKPNGILSLVIPDKRYTFDITRNESILADVIGAFIEKRTKASPSSIYDYFAECRTNIVAAEVWSNESKDFSKKPHICSLDEAYRRSDDGFRFKDYVDVHCYAFTPHSFMNILRRLIEHDLLDYEVIDFQDTEKYQLEFYVTLKKCNKGVHNRARQLNSIPKIKQTPELRGLDKKVAYLKSQLDHLYNSKSWRLTKPLRDLRRKIQRNSR